MKKLFLAMPAAIVALVGFWYLSDLSMKTREEGDALEENHLREEWMNRMLLDPSTGRVPEGYRTKELQFLRTMRMDGNDAQRERSIWTFRGPDNVGGRTRALAVDVLNENHLLAGGVSGGIWQSMDAGNSWTRVTLPNDHPGVVSISQDTRPGKEHIWYALSGELSGTSASGGNAFYLGDGAFRSTDNGNTWKPLVSTANANPAVFSEYYQGGWRIACSPKDSAIGTIYMATYGSIYRSVDTGNTWGRILGSSTRGYYTDVAIDSKGVVYATISSDGSGNIGFYRSANGVNFTKITPTGIKNYERTVLCINPNNENEVYFFSELGKDSSGGVVSYNYENTPSYVSLFKYTYLSGNGSGTGGSWENLSGNLPVTDPDQFDKLNTQGGYDMVLKVQPVTNHIIIGGTNLYLSTDGFTSPNHTTQIGGYGIGTQLGNFTTYPNHHPDQHDIIFSRSDYRKVYSVSDGGVRYCNNINSGDVTWEDKNTGYHTSQLYTVAINQNVPFDQWILAGLQDNANYLTRTSNSKSPWNLTINGDGSYNYIAPDRSFCIISTQLGNVRKVILDENGSVLKRKRIDPEGIDKNLYNFINPIVVEPNEGRMLFMPINKTVAIYPDIKSIPVVQDLNKLTSGWYYLDTITTPDDPNGYTARVTALAVSTKPSNILYIGTSNQDIYKIINPSSSNRQITKLTPTDSIMGSYVSSICVDPEDANKIFVTYSNYGIPRSMVYSPDGGNKWYNIGGNLESNTNSSGAAPSIRCFNMLKKTDGSHVYFAGTSIGLFSTDSLILSDTSNATVWTQESPDAIGANVIMDIKTRNSDGFVAIATHGGGAYSSFYTGQTAPADATFVSSTSLYPNPANDYFNFSFNALYDQTASAFMVDMMGRRVKSIFNEKLNSGTMKWRVDISDLAPGSYKVVFYNGSDRKPIVQDLIKL